MGLLSPGNDEKFKERTKTFQKLHNDEKGVESAEVAVYLPAMWVSCWQTDKTSTELEKTRNWWTFLGMFNQFMRPCEVYKFCPDYSSVSFGPIDADGIPSRFQVSLCNWKGRTGSGEYVMVYKRNNTDIKYCPCFWFLRFNQLSGITCGPIFQQLSRDGKSALECVSTAIKTAGKDKVPVYLDNFNMQVNFSYSALERMINKMHCNAGFKQLSMYSIRKTATKWGARCGAKEWHLKNTGRWTKTSTHFHFYVQEGQWESEMALENGTEVDPIRLLWVYKPTTFHPSIAPELDK